MRIDTRRNIAAARVGIVGFVDGRSWASVNSSMAHRGRICKSTPTHGGGDHIASIETIVYVIAIIEIIVYVIAVVIEIIVYVIV